LQKLDKHVHVCGFVDRQTYWSILASADVVVSTAKHEFFGVAMLEAVYAGCYPLCPNRLVYPEIYPAECLYNTQQQLVKRLRTFCVDPKAVGDIKDKIDWRKYSWKYLEEEYRKFILEVPPTDKAQTGM
jgi:glycosyltransferase involved in cell wall biosynthesis